MMPTVNIKADYPMDREALRKLLAAPAWRIWTALARSDVMADSADRSKMLERHKIVVALIEVNSQQLRCDSAAAGLDIERLNAQREVERSDSTSEGKEALDDILRRSQELEEKKRRLAHERDWLETSLSEFDRQMAASEKQTKKAD